MMLNWNEYMQELTATVGEIGRTSPKSCAGTGPWATPVENH